MTVPRGWVSAALVGVLFGATAVGALRTAPWLAARLGVTRSLQHTAVPVGAVQPCAAGDATCADPAAVPVPVGRMAGLLAGVRDRAGCTQPLSLDTRLSAAAQGHADALAAGARLSHVDGRQRTPQDRAQAHGYPGLVVESIAAGIPAPDVAVDLWLNREVDPTTATRLSDCSARHLGVGWSDGRPSEAFGSGVWVVLHGRPTPVGGLTGPTAQTSPSR
jgi:hypothetical protein